MPRKTIALRHFALPGQYKAVAAKSISVTDEVSAVEHLGRKVVLVPNQDFNFKITYPRDFQLAEFVFKQRQAMERG